MSKVILQKGFTLITALFLLVVVALLSVYMINISSVQHTTLVYGVQGARAMSAARTGLEWGIHQAIRNDVCNSSNPAFNTNGAGKLDTFSIDVTCSSTDHDEGAVTVRTYVLTSSAQVGSFGTLDYVYRSLQASVSRQPP